MDIGVAVWQMAPTLKDPAANLARLDAAARRAREQGATLLVTPELALTGYDSGDLDALAVADGHAHPEARWIRGGSYGSRLSPEGLFDARWLDEAVAGVVWLAVGLLWLVVHTRGFRRRPPEVQFGSTT